MRDIAGRAEEGVCIKCREPYVLENGHECLEELTIDQLFQSCISDVRNKMAEIGHDVEVKAATCDKCKSEEVECWGESGVFWMHCHDCGHDGPDLPIPNPFGDS